MTRNLLKHSEPKAYQAMQALEKYGEEITAITKGLKAIIKIRASQINGCDYCIAMHTDEALKINETRIREIENWETSDKFTTEEKLALKLTEAVTMINREGVPDGLYTTCLNTFGETLTAQIIMLVIIINSWNRIAIATDMKYKKQ